VGREEMVNAKKTTLVDALSTGEKMEK